MNINKTLISTFNFLNLIIKSQSETVKCFSYRNNTGITIMSRYSSIDVKTLICIGSRKVSSGGYETMRYYTPFINQLLTQYPHDCPISINRLFYINFVYFNFKLLTKIKNINLFLSHCMF